MTANGARSVALLLALALAACHKNVSPQGADPAPSVEGESVILPPGSPQLASLSMATVSGAVRRTIHLNGRLIWNEDVTVRVFTPLAGRVTKVLVDVGQRVQPGDALALIAAPDLGQAQADVHRASTDLALAEKTLTRMRDLFDHGIVARKDLEAAEADAARARAEAERANARLALYGSDSSKVDQVFPLRTPLGGTVVERNLNPGQEVRPDQMLANAPQLFSPLFVVSDPSRLWVQIDVPERDLRVVRPGQAIAIRTPVLPERACRGKIELVASSVDPGTRTVKARGSAENPGGLLKAELFVTVDLAAPPDQGVEVPATAVFLQGDRPFAFVEEGPGRFIRREVEIGTEHDGQVPVIAGVKAGEQVVTEGGLLLMQLLARDANP